MVFATVAKESQALTRLGKGYAEPALSIWVGPYSFELFSPAEGLRPKEIGIRVMKTSNGKLELFGRFIGFEGNIYRLENEGSSLFVSIDNIRVVRGSKCVDLSLYRINGSPDVLKDNQRE